MYIFLLLLGMVAFGFSNVCWKPLLAQSSTNALMVRRSAYSASFLGVLYLLLSATYPGIPVPLRTLVQSGMPFRESFPASMFYISISMAGLFLFVNSMRYQQAGISGIIICLSSCISATLSWLIQKEPFSAQVPVSLAICCAGVLLLEKTRVPQQTERRGLLMAISAACCWGFANIGFKELIPRIGVLQFSLLQEISVLVVSTCLLWIANKKKSSTLVSNKTGSLGTKKQILIFLIGLSTVVGILFCNLGMKQLPLSVFSILVLSQPLTTLIFSSVWLKEQTSVRQKIGAVLILIGIYIVS